MAIDNEILEDFKEESKGLVEELLYLLEEAEDNPSAFKNLDQYGQTVDRIMGGAKSLATNFPEDFPKDHILHKIGDYAAICKAVGYKTSQVSKNPQFFNVCVAFLLDSTEMLEKLLANLRPEVTANKEELFTKTFLERIKWINSQFKEDVRSTVSSGGESQPGKMKQSEIDDLLKKLGID